MKVGVQRYGYNFVIDDDAKYYAGFGLTKLRERQKEKGGYNIGRKIADDFGWREFRDEYGPYERHQLEVIVTTPKHYNQLLRKADAWEALQ